MPLHDTRGAASATGFGFGANTATDWSKYAMVPYNTADANPNTIAFLNVPTNTVDYYVTMPTTSRNCVLRMGNYLVIGRDCSFWVKDIRTNATVQSQTTPFGSEQTGDFFKFGIDKFGIMTKTDNKFQVVTLQINANGTTSQIAINLSVDTWGTATGFNGPMGAAIVTCDAKGMFQSFTNYVTVRSIFSYVGGSTATVNGNFAVSTDGTSIVFSSGAVTSENFSRPSSSSGGLGAAIVYDMDHSSYYISTGSENAMTGFTASGSGTPTNFRGCGVVQSQAFLNMGWDGASNGYIRRMIASGATTPLNYSVLSSAFYGTMQMYGNGAFFAYNAASGTAVYRTYSSITDTFSSEIVPSGILSSGLINKSGTVYGTYNY